MHLIDNGVRFNANNPFRHALLFGNVMADDRYILRMDIADPIGVSVETPYTARPFKFDRPTIAMLLIRKDDRAVSSFMPLELLAHLQANADVVTTLAKDAWLERGGDPVAVNKVLRTIISALDGTTHRPDRFGVKDWTPTASMPFGLIMSGPWLGTPETEDTLTYTVETKTEEVDA